MKKIFALLYVSITILACSGGLYDELNRSSDDPELSEPSVVSFREEAVISINWDDDVLADEYVLYRALDGDVLNFREIYRGGDFEFRDSDGILDQIYHYSLAKVRGLKEFDRSDSAFGVFSMTTEDIFEDNNTKDNATSLEQGIIYIANLYGYLDSFQNDLTDEDWYRVSVPPGRTAYVVIKQILPTATGESTDFLLYLEGQPAVEVLEDEAIQIINGLTHTQDYLFKIYPDPKDFFAASESAGGIASYRIFIQKVE